MTCKETFFVGADSRSCICTLRRGHTGTHAGPIWSEYEWAQGWVNKLSSDLGIDSDPEDDNAVRSVLYLSRFSERERALFRRYFERQVLAIRAEVLKEIK